MSNQQIHTFPILLAGGTGTRLWPVSRQRFPKQMVKFIGEESLIQSTMKRLAHVIDAERIIVVCGKEHFHEIEKHMAEIDIQPDGKIICEPCARNTAPAILLAILEILKKETDAVLCVFPADHVIKDIEDFHEKLASAVKLAEMGHIVTFGIKPHYPETGYGYIEGSGEVLEGALSIKRFVEKPDIKTAKKYIEAGNFFWNSGMFAFKASVMMDEFRVFQKELLESMENLVSIEGSITLKGYEQLPNISIDYAVMEKTDRGVVLPSDFGWSDIGTWKSLYNYLPKDENNNVIKGDVISKDTKNSLIMGHERLIATNYLDNMVVVETADSVFVSDMDRSRDVKSIVENLKETERREFYTHNTVNFPWGSCTVLEHEADIKVTRIVIYPGSLFEDRSEALAKKHLLIVKGEAKIITDKSTRLLSKGESAIFSEKEVVKLENPGIDPLCLIQVELDT
ncbi:mannose-1-phosphate guanylyltransferase/mannose-6-phosphate isomerase [Thermodesulfobacteriota bacterium]